MSKYENELSEKINKSNFSRTLDITDVELKRITSADSTILPHVLK